MRFKNIDDILEWFADEGSPNYIVWTKDGICARGTFKTTDEAADKLAKDLQRVSADEFGTHYTVSVSDKPIQSDTKKKDLVYCIFISPKKESTTEGGNIASGGNWLYQELKHTQQQLQAAHDEIIRLRTEQESDDDEELEAGTETNTGGILGSLMSSPQVQAAIVPFLAGLLSPEPKQPQAMAGVDTEQTDKIKKAVTTLLKYDDKLGDHLQKLAAIAQNDTKQFSFLISMLDNA